MKNIRLLIILLLISSFSTARGQDKTTLENMALLNKKLTEKEATIWYLGHFGYAVKTKSKLLIFDYQEKVKKNLG